MMNKKRPRVAISFGQRRMWMLDQIEDAPVTYNMPWALRLKGHIELDSLEKSLIALVERHVPLRTMFEFDSRGEPRAYLLDPPAAHQILSFNDLSHESPVTQQQHLKTILDQEASTGFDLSSDYALRCRLIKLSPEEHVLALTLHHHAADGMSAQVFSRDLSVAYAAFCHQRTPDWPALKIQYPDWAAWQKQQLEKKDASGQTSLQVKLNRAKQRIKGFPELLTLPLDRPRHAHRKRTSALCKIGISDDISRKVSLFAQSRQTTPFTVILAVYATLLSRLSNQQEVVIGSPMAGRNRAETLDMVGFFVNSLVYPISVTPTDHPIGLVDQCRKTYESVLSDQDLPFELIVDALGVDRSLAHTPVFQAGLSFQSFSADAQPVELEGLSCQLEDTTLKQAKYELALFVSPDTQGRLSGVFEYDADLFDATTVQAWSHAFSHLLSEFVEHPESALITLPLQDRHTRLQKIALSQGANMSGAGEHHGLTLADLFQAQAQHRGSSIALTFENHQYTYQELHARSNQLARYLISLGVGADDLVAILLDRTPETIIAMLGILKAGAAYLPMDKSHPTSRLNYILSDSRARVLISLRILTDNIQIPEHTVWLDESQAWQSCSTDDIDAAERLHPLLPDHVAYLIYTSGSTGQPKGVANTHRNVVRLLDQTHGWFQFGDNDVWSLFHSIAFDFSVWEIWGAFAYGGRLVMIPDNVRKSPSDFLALLKRERITVLNQTPPSFEVLAQHAIDSGLHFSDISLRWIIFGGSALNPPTLKGWWKQMDNQGPRLVNMYGITETTVHVTYCDIWPEHTSSESSPIGVPIPDLATYVLDTNLEPVPPGVIGEIYVAGQGLARGYFNRPGLTASRFIACPFDQSGKDGQLPETRMYRSGDLGRMLHDGSIEYLGRADDQVKIRGYRIELGEIEAAIGNLEPAQKSLCLAYTDANHETRLVSYIVLSQSYIERLSQDVNNEDTREAEWESLYDETYRRSEASERDFDITGWESTYTRTAIPSREMAVWQSNTVDRILKLHPRRMLEIGCGTGLLMWKLLSSLESYFGTDLSAQTVNKLQSTVRSENIQHARFAHGVADDFSIIPEQIFDTAIVNSVIQYFPSQKYLTNVIQGLLRRVNGSVFIGDVRSLRHLGAFWCSVELFASSPDEPVAQVAKRVSRRIKSERELLVHPSYFEKRGIEGPHLAVAEIQIKRETFDNEMSRWRYDVTLHACSKIENVLIQHDLRWDGLVSLKAHLHLHPHTATQVTLIPNARVAADVWAYQHLTDFVGTVSELREQSLRATSDAIDPAELYQLADQTGMRVRLMWCPSDPASLIALFEPQSEKWGRWIVHHASTLDELALTNNPLSHAVEAEALRTISSDVAKLLPAYMVPSKFIAIDDIPLTPNGKIDRKALPNPVEASSNEAYRPPVTSSEALLCQLFSEITGAPVVGLDDDFFKIGGHSLLAMRLVAGIKQSTGKELPLRLLFSTPTVAKLAVEIDKIGHQSTPPLVTGMGKMAGNQIALSYGQMRLWVLSKIEKDSVSYNMPWAISLKGDLDIEALHSALVAIVQQHVPLRTVMVSGPDGHPVGQLIDVTDPNQFIRHVDFCSAENNVSLESMIAQETNRPFDLASDIPIRVLIIKLSNDEHILVLTLHHHAADGVSVNIFIREINQLYQHYFHQPLPMKIRGQSHLAEHASYADWAAWQALRLNQPTDSGRTELHGKIDRARQRLQHAPEILNLPLDRPRQSGRARLAGVLPVTLSDNLTLAVEQLALQHHTTVFTILLSTYGLLLSRLSQQETVLVGTPVAGRTTPEIENLIGFFVNTVVLPIHVSPTTQGYELIEQVRQTTQSVLIDQELPFEKLVEELGVSRSLSHSPIFQAMFAFQSQAGQEDDIQLPGIIANSVSSPAGQAKYDLNLILSPDSDGKISGAFEFDADLFDLESVQRWSAAWIQLVSLLAAYPAKPVCTLNMLDLPQEQQVIKDSGGPAVRISDEDLTFHRLFSERVLQYADHVALEHGSVRMTYAEVDTASNKLARLLMKSGVQTGDAVCFMIERSIEQIIALIAILKAGAAYVPLDTDYPLNRLSFMATDSQAKVLLTQQSFVDSTIAQIQASTAAPLPPLIILDQSETILQTDECSSSPLDAQEFTRLPRADDLVYVLYTSGSTGTPKGVGMTHRGMLNLTYWQQARYGKYQQRVLQYSPISFDASAQELFSAIDCGATLVLVDKDTRRDMPALLTYMEQHQIDVLYAPFVVLSNLAQAFQQGRGTYWPRTINTAGEQLNITPEIRKTYLSQPQARLHNFYGPTESHVVTAYSLVADPREWPDASPIGHAIDNTQIYILDESLNPVPKGVVGEIYIAGENLARGYINRPGMTASRFIACGFDRPGKRMYRSGDLGRVSNSGDIEFLGRADQQIKIRGFRVELGEVEAMILSHFSAQLSHAAVIAMPGATAAQGLRLVGYLVPHEGMEPPDHSMVRRAMLSHLPDYMVPSVFVDIGKLPLSPNGKLERRALPQPAESVDHHALYRAPVTATERRICQVFSDVTGIQSVGLDNNFFDLGGHSLLGMRLMHAIKQVTGQDLSLRAVFLYPTPELLSAHLDEIRVVPSVYYPLVPLKTSGTNPPLFCVHPGGGIATVFSQLAKYIQQGTPVWGIQAKGLENDETPHEDIGSMAEAYIQAMRTIQPQGPYHVLGWSQGGLIAQEMAVRLEHAGEKVALVALLDTTCNIPHELEPTHTKDVDAYVNELLINLCGVNATDLVEDRSAKLDQLIAFLVANQFIPAGTSQDWVIRIIRQMMHVPHQSHRHAPAPCQAPILFFGATREASTIPPIEHAWEELTRKGLSFYPVDTHHMTMCSELSSKIIANHLNDWLETNQPD